MKLVYKIDIKELPFNPLPYKRTTQRQKWVDEGYKKYQEWKSFILCEFFKQNKITKQLSGAYFVEVKMTFKDKKHADPDNVAKGINDAIFKNDKFVSGKYTFDYANSAGITILIYKD